MKTKTTIPENFNSVFVNVTISAKADGIIPMMDLLICSRGNWVIDENCAKKIKYLYPVKRNKILRAFEVTGYTLVEQNGKNRIRFDLKPIYENVSSMLIQAEEFLNKTNYVVKYFETII